MARSNLLTAVRLFAAGLTAFVCVAGAVYGEEVKSERLKPLILTEKDDDRDVAIKVDEEVEIKLLEEIGDRWVVESHNGEFVALMSLKSARAIGSSDRVSFSFRGQKAGTEEIALKRNRGSSVIDRFHVQVRVKPHQ